MKQQSFVFVLVLILPTLALLCCSTSKERIPPVPEMNKQSGKMVIYQMMTRLFGNKNATNKLYGTIEENGVGKFNDINDTALDKLADMGVTHVWYTGVIEHAVLTDYTVHGIPLDDADVVKGRAGSPYAIKDYYDVDPDLAVDVPNRMVEFEQLIDRTHQHGLKVLIDFVPNHVARFYHSDAKPKHVVDLGELDDRSKSFDPDNNFYYLPGESFKVPRGYVPLGPYRFPTKDGQFSENPAKVTGNDQFTSQPTVNDWFETVKLNYGVDIQNGRRTYFNPVPDTWKKMKDILAFWASKKVDGFRCDMAEMVPVEFWQWVIPQIKELNNDIVFIAEIYQPDLYRTYLDAGNFDYLYDKSLLYDTLRNIITGRGSTLAIPAIQKRLEGITNRMLHFMENHDEQRAASSHFAGDPWKVAPAMVISATIDRGPVMIYFGQEVGEPGSGAEGFQGDDGRTTIFDYWGVPEHQKWMNEGKFDGERLSSEQKLLRMFYGDLLSLAGNNTAIAHGDYLDITESNVASGNIGEDVHVFLRYHEEERLLIVNSFNSETKTVKISLPQEAVTKMGLDPDGTYIARDLLFREAEVGFDGNWSFSLQLKPYSCFILKIK